MTKRIVDYAVHTTFDGMIAQFEIQIREMIEDGWQPFGGIAFEDSKELIDGIAPKVIYSQAMVKYED